MTEPSPYEARALREIRLWKDPASHSFFQKVVKTVNKPFVHAGGDLRPLPNGAREAAGCHLA
jgi:hypothetical protein